MPREILTITVGQAGNQIGWRFWDMVVREHAALSKPGIFDDGMSTFFRNERDLDDESGPVVGRAAKRPSTLNSAAMALPDSLFSESPLGCLKARSILVDMEEGVVNQVLRSPMGELFDRSQLITDVSGAGNNWAHGFHEYGPKYHSTLLEKIRLSLEACDSPQSFFMVTSTGGGTGSGLGSYILEQLADQYPEIYRFNAAVFPSEDDDVVTSPYNFTLAFDKLVQHSDCVMPLENQALIDVAMAVEGGLRKLARTGGYGSAMGSSSTGASAFAEARMSALTFVPPPPIRPSKLAFAPLTPYSSSASVLSGGGASRATGRRPQRSLLNVSGITGGAGAAPSSPVAPPAPVPASSVPATTTAPTGGTPTTGRRRMAGGGLGKPTVGILPGMATVAPSASRNRLAASNKLPTVASSSRPGTASGAVEVVAPEEPVDDSAAALQRSLAAADAAIARALAVARDPANAPSTTASSAPKKTAGAPAAAAGTSTAAKRLATATTARALAKAGLGPAAATAATTGVAGALGGRTAAAPSGASVAGRKPSVPTQQRATSSSSSSSSASSTLAPSAASGPSQQTKQLPVAAPLAAPALMPKALSAPKPIAHYGDADEDEISERRADEAEESRRRQRGQASDSHYGGKYDDGDEEGPYDEDDDGDNQDASASVLGSNSTSGKPASKSSNKGTAFDAMNNLAAHLLVNLTASMRFEGPHNVDLNEIASTLVPFPRMHVLQAAVSPLFVPPGTLAASSSSSGGRDQKAVDAMFSSAFHRDLQLIRGDPRRSVHLACGLFARGPGIKITDVTRNVERLKREITMVHWNSDGFKTGICSAPPLFRPYSLLSLSNNTSVVPTLTKAHARFMHLYRVRAHAFHYEQYMDVATDFAEAARSLADMISSYNEMESDELGAGGGGGGGYDDDDGDGDDGHYDEGGQEYYHGDDGN